MSVKIQIMSLKRYFPFKCTMTFRNKFMMWTTMITCQDMIKNNDISSWAIYASIIYLNPSAW